MKNNDRLRAFSKPLNADADAPRPHEIVLLEDHDLYKYQQQQQFQQQQLHLQQQQQQQYLPQQQQQQRRPYDFQRPPSVTVASSEAPPDHDPSRHYRYAPTTVSSRRKPSFTSVDTVPLTHGALRPGGAVQLFSSQYIGLLLNWMLVGFFNTAVQQQMSSLGDLVSLEGYQASASSALLNAPFQFKFLAGLITDCVPINRQRRKPYLFIGWSVLMVFMACMAFRGEPTAETNASSYIIALTCGSFARVLLMSTCEGLMIEYSQREGEFFRGRTLAWCLIFRFIGETVGAMGLQLALASPKYGGKFDHSVPFPIIFAFYAILCASGISITKFLLVEDQSTLGNQRFASQLRGIWNILQQRTTWQITVFGFLVKMAVTYQVYQYKSYLKKWLKAPVSLGNTLADTAVSSSGYIFAAFIFMRFLLNTNWRKTLFWSFTIGLLIMVPSDMLAVFDGLRNFVFSTIMNQLVGVSDAMLYVLRIVTIIEVVEPGYEAVTYGIITTALNLSANVVNMIRNQVGTTFTADEVALTNDDTATRWHVAYQFIFKYTLRIMVLLVVWHLLPRQKRHLKERKLRSNPSLLIPVVLFVLLGALFISSVTANLLAQFESTACHIFAGGKGCK